jgi:arylsulfatase A-like enzyme
LRLKERNLWNNTLVVITADHGEEFGEHRTFGHGNSLYLTSLHVPLMISFPGRIPGATRVHTPITLRDLPATIADVLHFNDGTRFPGASLARYWNGAETVDDEPLLSELNHATGQPEWFPISKGNMKSLLFRGLRYIKNGDGTEELYDFYKDPLETNNLVSSDAHRASLAEFRALLDQSVQ